MTTSIHEASTPIEIIVVYSVKQWKLHPLAKTIQQAHTPPR